MTFVAISDPRPPFFKALAQVETGIRAVRPDQLTNATPCAEYDVRTLIGHILAVMNKIARVGDGGSTADQPDVVVLDDETWIEAFEDSRSEIERAWADDAVLDRQLTLPWARLPGREVLDAYTHEFTVHSWDLAAATGQLADLDPGLGADALAWFTANEPAESRTDGSRFGFVVQAADDADVYTRLAAFTGRQVDPNRTGR